MWNTSHLSLMCKYKVLQEYLHITSVCLSHSPVSIYNDFKIYWTPKHLKEFDSFKFFSSLQNKMMCFKNIIRALSTTTSSNQTLAYPFQRTWQNFMAKNMSPLAFNTQELEHYLLILASCSHWTTPTHPRLDPPLRKR